jgi:flagellar hook-basal body complex protein FliE
MDSIRTIGGRPEGVPESAKPAAHEAATASKTSFGRLVENAVTDTERLQETADGMVKGLAQGEITDVHEVMLAMTRADLSFRMMLEVRNKLLEAYQEVMRMQV